MLSQLINYVDKIKSDYVLKIPSFDGIILFNRTNGSIVKLSRLTYETIDSGISYLPTDSLTSIIKDLELIRFSTLKKLILLTNLISLRLSLKCQLYAI